MRAEVIAALRQLSGGYIRDRRASGELRSRIVTVAHERSRLMRGVELHQHTELTQRKLAENESVRTELERSARAADDRLRAVEAVIAAVVTEAAAPQTAPLAEEVKAREGRARPAPVRAPHPSRLRPKAPRAPAAGPDVPLRGGWSRPGGGD
jgi:hypothetical protein